MWSLRIVLLMLATIIIVSLLLFNESSRRQIKALLVKSKPSKKSLKKDNETPLLKDDAEEHSIKDSKTEVEPKHLKISRDKKIISAIDELSIQMPSSHLVFSPVNSSTNIDKYKKLVDKQYHNLSDSENQRFYRKVEAIGQDNNELTSDEIDVAFDKVYSVDNKVHNLDQLSSDEATEDEKSYADDVKDNLVPNQTGPVEKVSSKKLDASVVSKWSKTINKRHTLDNLFNHKKEATRQNDGKKNNRIVHEDKDFDLFTVREKAKKEQPLDDKAFASKPIKSDIDLTKIPVLDNTDDFDKSLTLDLVIDYDCFIQNAESKALAARLAQNTLSDIVYKQRLDLVKDWYLTAKESLSNSFNFSFLDEENQEVASQEVLFDEDLSVNKSLIKELNYCDLKITLNLCGIGKSIDVARIKSFQSQCQHLADLYSSQVNYSMSDAKLYETIQEVDRVKKELDKIFIIQLNAKPNQVFTGKEIKRHALAFGFSYGYKKLFHKFQNEINPITNSPMHGFSLLNRYSPGYFEFEQLNEIETKGVCLVVKPVLSFDPSRLVKEFVENAKDWQRVLNANLYVPRSNFTQRENHDLVNQNFDYEYFAKELEFYLNALAKSGIVPGSDIAQRLFSF